MLSKDKRRAAREAFENALMFGSCLYNHSRDPRPGSVIQRMNAENRAALENLTAEDINHEGWMRSLAKYERAERLKKEKNKKTPSA